MSMQTPRQTDSERFLDVYQSLARKSVHETVCGGIVAPGPRSYDCAVEAHLELAYDGTVVAVPLWAGRLTLGRADSNNLPIKDDAVSRVHASVERIAGQYVLRDLGSSNGTLVNGERIIADRALHPDDEITVGHTRIVFRGAAEDLAETLRIPLGTAVGLGDR